jgi:metal-sulfur cluster biosynthetic enzyme
MELGMPNEMDIKRALRRVKDPELHLDLVVLGLVYGVEIDDSHVRATISLTSPFCPVAGQILEEAQAAIEGVEGVETAEVELTFDPPWTPERIDPIIRASLGI